MLSLADRFRKSQPDLVVLLGDRSEILAAATAAFDARIPIAHIHGGEDTAGSQDNVRRHCITLMASCHFAATEMASYRIAQLRRQTLRNTDHIYCVGSLGLDDVPPAHRDKDGTYLLIYHPVTLAPDYGMGYLENLLDCLDHELVDIIGPNPSI